VFYYDGWAWVDGELTLEGIIKNLDDFVFSTNEIKRFEAERGLFAEAETSTDDQTPSEKAAPMGLGEGSVATAAEGDQGAELKETSQGKPAKEEIMETTEETITKQGQAGQESEAEGDEPARERVFFRTRIARSLGLAYSSSRAAETLRKTLEQEGFPTHFDDKGNRWNYRDEIDNWKENHAEEIAVLNDRKRKPKKKK
jgi:hypothetical protein